MTTFTQYWINMAGNKKKHLEKGVITKILTCHCVTFSLSILTVITAYIVWKYSEYIVFKFIMGEYLTRFCKLKVEISTTLYTYENAVYYGMYLIHSDEPWLSSSISFNIIYLISSSSSPVLNSSTVNYCYTSITCNNQRFLRLWSLLLWTEFVSLKAGVRTREVSDECIYYCWK